MTHDGNHTVYQFVDQNKVILDGLLINFSKVGLSDRDEAVAVLEYEGGISVGSDHVSQLTCSIEEVASSLGNGNDVEIVNANVEEARRAQRDDG